MKDEQVTDRELLELAAKAAGLTITVDPKVRPGLYVVSKPCGETEFFDPLNEDGDALRLAVKLNLHLKMSFDAMPPYICAGVENLNFDPDLDLQETQWLAWESCEDPLLPAEDPCAMTRRSIVHAAAEIGRSMP